MNKNVSLLAISYVFGFTAATITVFLSGIIGSQITSIQSLATLPTALSVVGTAICTIFAAKVMSKIGRRSGFIFAALVSSASALLAKLKTWQTADIRSGPVYNNDFKKALKSISARTILMPCNQDLYFRTKDNEIEAEYIKNASLRPIDSPFGHCAANPGNDKNFELQLDKNINELLR